MRDERLEQIDVLLCDIQGAELDMLAGAVEAIGTGALRFVLLSTHHHQISGDPLTHQRCLDTLVAAGAHIVAEHSVSESCSGDGLIVASFDPRDAELRVAVTKVRAQDSLFGEGQRATSAIGYVRPIAHDSLTQERDEAGQVAALNLAASRRGWDLRETIIDRDGRRDRDVLGAMNAGVAEVLAIADVSRWPGAEDLSELASIAKAGGWRVACSTTGLEQGPARAPKPDVDAWLAHATDEETYDLLARLTPLAATRREPTFLFSTADVVVSRDLYSFSEFDEAELAWTLDYLGQPQVGSVVVEIGGNVGSTTISLLARHNAGSVVVFEPAPGNIRLLRCNLILNELEDRAIVQRIAISDRNGTVELELAPDNLGDHRVRTAAPADWFLARRGHPRHDLRPGAHDRRRTERRRRRG